MANTGHIQLELFVGKEKEGLYFELPFEVPEGVERIDIRYGYERRRSSFTDGQAKTEEINVIDLALSSNTGEFIGSSGSNRDHVQISEYCSSDGYARVRTLAGTWNIIVGAYKVHKAGVKVTYNVTFTYKERRLLKGDCHIHTTGSDGVLTVEEAAGLAKAGGLDFLFITDHNNYSHNSRLISDDGLTLIPGVEWTHFNGHANMLGVERPFKGKYYANSLEEVRERLDEARRSGALVSVNHPFDAGCPWKWGLDNGNFDCVEIWNGVMKSSDMQCISWWHGELCKGRRLPIIGGSDFHRFSNFSAPGMPATCVYSMSRGPADILEAIRQGHSFVAFQPDAPAADIRCARTAGSDATQSSAVACPDGAPAAYAYGGELKRLAAGVPLNGGSGLNGSAGLPGGPGPTDTYSFPDGSGPTGTCSFPGGPGLTGGFMGDEIPFAPGLIVQFDFSSLKKGDLVKIHSAAGIEREITARHAGDMSFGIPAEGKRFYRAEVYRRLLPDLPPMLCLITNPIYFR